MEEWKEYKLGEICGLVPGFAFKSKDFGSGKDFAIKIKDIRPPYVETKDADSIDISNYNIDRLSKFIVHKGEFLLAMTGATIGKIGKYIDEKPAYVNQRVLKFVDIGKVSYDYIYYFLSTDTFQIFVNNHIDSQSAQPNISANTIGKYIVNVPSIDEQRSIASILKSLDDKIEVNRKINENLEQQAQALFKSWFVDFEPFKNGEFVESELGKIPKGWRVGKLGEFVKTTSGGTPSRKENDYYINGTINWIKSKELQNSFIVETEEKITDEAIKNSSAKLLPTHSVLIAMYGATVGEFGIITQPMTCNQAVCALLPNNNVPYSILYMFARNNKNALQSKAIGSAQQNISQVIIKEMSFVFNEKAFSDFNCIVEPMLRQIENIFLESHRLATLRDALLPKLMSGELKVNDMRLSEKQ